MQIELNTITQGDCLDLLPHLASGSVDMVLCDLPYGTAMGMGLDGWKNSTLAWDIAIDPAQLFVEYERVLRMGGCAILFGQEPYTSQLITKAHNNLPFSYRCVWIKDHFANALLCKKAPVNYFEDILVFFKRYDCDGQHPLRAYAERVMQFCGLDLKAINITLGHRRAEHFFYTKSTQFGLCTEVTYNELVSRFGFGNEAWFKSYSELVRLDAHFRPCFNLEGRKFKGNVLNFRKDYEGLHPTQKPVALFDYLIRTYTNEGDTVLDNCCGSGTTGVACQNNGRNFIQFELDPKYCEIARQRLAASIGKT